MTSSKQYTELSISQMLTEIEEYKAESSHMMQVLSAVGIDVYQRNPKIDNQLVKTLSTAADTLSVVDVDDVNLQMSASDLKNNLRKTRRDIEDIRRRIQLYKQNLEVFSEQRKSIEAANSFLTGREGDFAQDVNKSAKSTYFHSKKKAQYLSNVQTTQRHLHILNYDEDISHESLTKLGTEVQTMEDRLKYLRLSLKSYEDLPPSLIDSQIKLDEKKLELSELEAQLADAIGDVAGPNLQGSIL